MRRTGRKVTYAKVYGTPTQNPTPQAIDDWSGFKVNLKDLRKQWDGHLTVNPDKRNPQDFLRGIKDNMALPYSRPEPPDTFVAGPIIWQTGAFMTTQTGQNLLTEGVDPSDTL
jgi:hypothetical protein